MIENSSIQDNEFLRRHLEVFKVVVHEISVVLQLIDDKYSRL